MEFSSFFLFFKTKQEFYPNLIKLGPNKLAPRGKGNLIVFFGTWRGRIAALRLCTLGVNVKKRILTKIVFLNCDISLSCRKCFSDEKKTSPSVWYVLS